MIMCKSLGSNKATSAPDGPAYLLRKLPLSMAKEEHHRVQHHDEISQCHRSGTSLTPHTFDLKNLARLLRVNVTTYFQLG